jgi:Family of unknown function (DUF6502)
MPSSEAHKQLLYALRRFLRPIVRILVRTGIRFDEFVELVRGVYIESAIRDGIDNADTPTRERISLATGVTRQQVDYYIENERALPVAEPTLSHVVTEVLHKWHTHPRYLGPYGIPVELEFDAPYSRSFTHLVSMVDRTANPGVVLDELLRAGSATHSGENHIRALSRVFINPDGMSPSRIEDFGSTLTRFVQTLEHNFNPVNAETKRLERFVGADKGLPRALLPAFEAHARTRTQHFLGELDSWLAQYSEVSSSESGPRAEIGVNVFFYIDLPSEEGPLSALVQPSKRLGPEQ